MKRLRVLLSTDVYAPVLKGGQELIVQSVAEGLAARGHTVAVATLAHAGLKAYEIQQGVPVYRKRGLDLTGRIGLQASFAPGWRSWMLRLIRDFKPEVILASNLFYCTTPGTLLAARLAGIPTILSLQLNGPGEIGGLPARLAVAYERTLGRLMIQLASSIVCAGPSVAQHCHELGGSPERVSVIYNGVDPQRFWPPRTRPRKPVILFAGRLITNKGPDVFVEAARRICSVRTDVEFWLLGDGPMRKVLERSVATQERIRFFGLRKDVPDIMRQASVFVRPSTLEGLPLAIIEAMATGLPVVATDIPGNRDLVEPGVTGCLVPLRNPDMLAAALLHLIDNEAVRARMGDAAYRRVQSAFWWDNIVRQFELVGYRAARREHLTEDLAAA